MGCAQTGSGKIVAFLLPIIDNLLKDSPSVKIGRPDVIIMTATPDMAIKVTKNNINQL